MSGSIEIWDKNEFLHKESEVALIEDKIGVTLLR